MKILHERARGYFGGMSPIVPIVFVAALFGIFIVGDWLGNSFFLAIGISVAGIIGYGFYAVNANSKRLVDSELIPFSAGLVAAVLVGASGLGLGGFGSRWGFSSLILAMLVATGAIAGVRAVMAKKARPH